MQFDPSSPIWLQLVDEFTRRIVIGQWPAGARIAGVRDLATELKVNPNTVQKAYRLLEEEGLIQSHTGAKSCVVADEAARSRVRTQLLGQDARAMISAMKQMGVTREEALALLDALWKEES